MKKKLTILLFGLLLAVGWTNVAQAQMLPNAEARHMDMRTMTKKVNASKHAINVVQATANEHQGSLRANAPLRTQEFDLNATTVHEKSWYQNLPDVTWDGGSQNITQPFTDAKGMMALLKRIYTDKDIPGAKYSAPRNCDIPYQTIEHGWNIIGTNYNDPAYIFVSSNQVHIVAIYIFDGNGVQLRDPLTPNNTTFPSAWSIGGSGNSAYWYTTSSDGGGVSIPASWLVNETGHAEVFVLAEPSSPAYNGETVIIGNPTYDYDGLELTYSDTEYSQVFYSFPGTITPPDDNGYTVLLVKLYDGINMTEDDLPPEYTSTTEELEDYFTTYVKEIQLLTDGMRVGNGTSDAGTVFAYTGDLNRFFFLSKGKMFYYSSIQGLDYDRAPFYSMYEEFSANDVADESGYTDFYVKMKQGVTYDIKHDCMGVNFRQHYFSMSGKQGTAENRVNSLVFYIPDNRGVLDSDWREYDPEHLPSLGMYMVDLFANIAPSTQAGYYTTTVTWEDNLDALTHTDGVPQIYTLYEVTYNELTGQNDTIQIYQGPNTSWCSADDPVHGDYPAGDPTAYDVYYFVVATPAAATNPETFFAQSSPDDVTIPGNSDFIGLQWWRYESDYVIQDSKNTEVNYYRNWLAPHKLSVQGQAGISAGNVGSEGRTLTLYRNNGKTDTPIIDLDLVMDGNRAYYRIRYRANSDQEIEPGYLPNGEVDPNYNPNNN